MAYGTSSAIEVKGLDELVRSFAKVDKALGREVRDAIRDAGEFVRVDAQERAVERIANIRQVGPGGQDWSRMRLGTTAGAIVYIVPRSKRRAGSRRPKFGTLLMRDAMIPALETNRAEIAKEVERAIENIHQNAHLIGALHNI